MNSRAPTTGWQLVHWRWSSSAARAPHAAMRAIRVNTRSVGRAHLPVRALLGLEAKRRERAVVGTCGQRGRGALVSLFLGRFKTAAAWEQLGATAGVWPTRSNSNNGTCIATLVRPAACAPERAMPQANRWPACASRLAVMNAPARQESAQQNGQQRGSAAAQQLHASTNLYAQPGLPNCQHSTQPAPHTVAVPRHRDSRGVRHATPLQLIHCRLCAGGQLLHIRVIGLLIALGLWVRGWGETQLQSEGVMCWAASFSTTGGVGFLVKRCAQHNSFKQPGSP